MTRFGLAITTYAATLFVALPSLFHHVPKLLWNASASVPVGLYAVRRAPPLHIGELVVVQPPAPLAQIFAVRCYLPLGVPLLKHILALPGQAVCRSGLLITIDGAAMGDALERDRLGLALPDWQGCRVLGPGKVFLINRAPPGSFDGRYFGPLPTTSIVGRAYPIWTHAEH